MTTASKTKAPNPRAARLSAGLTQTQAAGLIGATLRAFQEWEGNRRNMPAAKYALFCMLTGYTGAVKPPAAAPVPPAA